MSHSLRQSIQTINRELDFLELRANANPSDHYRHKIQAALEHIARRSVKLIQQPRRNEYSLPKQPTVRRTLF